MKYALIIGNDHYLDDRLSQLKTPAADSRALAQALDDKTIGAFDEVTTLVNESEVEARRAVSTFFAHKKPDDLVLAYFSGHGVLDDRGRLYLALKDTQSSLLKATAVPATFVVDEMDGCRSKRQILILDCCHSGAFERGTKGDLRAVTETTFEGSGFGRVVLTASDSTQYALEGDQVITNTELSLFTHHLLEGLKTGGADLNRDGWITLEEWYEYTYTQVVSETPRQVPHKWSYRQQGDLVIARNPQLEQKSAEESTEVTQGLKSPFASVREGAVRELGRLLYSGDAAIASSARSALLGVKAHDDSRRVSAAAQSMLSRYEKAAAQEGAQILPRPRQPKGAGARPRPRAGKRPGKKPQPGWTVRIAVAVTLTIVVGVILVSQLLTPIIGEVFSGAGNVLLLIPGAPWSIASATAEPPATTAMVPCPTYNLHSYVEFVVAAKCGMQAADAGYLADLSYDRVHYQYYLGDTWAQQERMGATEIQSLYGQLEPFLRVGRASEYRFQENLGDVSVFPYPPVYAEHSLCAAPTSGGWSICLGFDYRPDRYAITDVLLSCSRRTCE
jgi:uncharacterized caspase-like protein